MPLNPINDAQFAQFVKFATESGKNDIASISTTDGLEGRSITARKGDSVHALTRSSKSKKANNDVRNLFRDTVYRLFGGKTRVPESVLTAMELSDFDKGRPLTARRILAVQAAINAEKDSINVQSDNMKIANTFVNFRFERIPEEILTGLDELVAETVGRGGDAIPSNRTDFIKLLGPARVKTALLEKAQQTGLPLSASDVRDVIGGMVRNNHVVEQEQLKKKAKEIGADVLGVRNVERSTTLSLMKAVPGLSDALVGSKNDDDFQEVFLKFGPQIETHLAIMGAARNAKESSPERLLDAFAKATGLDKEFLREKLPLDKFRTGVAADIVEQFDTGERKATSARQVQEAFDRAIDAHVKKHLEAADQANDLANVSPAVRRSLRHGAIVAEKAANFKIKEFAPLAAQLDIGALREAALRKPFSKEAVAPALKALAESIERIGIANLTLGKWIEMGVDGQQPFANILVKCALDNDPELAKILAENAEDLLGATSELVPPEEPGTMSIVISLIPAAKELAEELQHGATRAFPAAVSATETAAQRADENDG